MTRSIQTTGSHAFMRLLEFHSHNDSQLEGREEEEEVEEEEEEEVDWV